MVLTAANDDNIFWQVWTLAVAQSAAMLVMICSPALPELNRDGADLMTRPDPCLLAPQ